MIAFSRSARIGLATVAAGMLLTNGCTLTHGSRPPAYSTVSPRNYCPGDVVTASYDLTQDTACVSRPGLDCATIAWPPIAIDSAPMSFPPRTFTASGGRLEFTPTAPRVDVTFAPPVASTSYAYPAAGNPSLIIRTISAQTRTIERIDGSIVRDLSNGGVCDGRSPAHMSAEIANLPEFSANLHVQQICNTSMFPIVATLASASGDVSRELTPGACFAPNEPGAPAVPAAGSRIGVRSLAVDPIAQCDPLQGMTPPRPLTTRAVLACGN